MPLRDTTYLNCSTGLSWGLFDLHVMPPNRLVVSIKCYFHTESRAQTALPVDLTSYITQFQAAVAQIWDNKIRIRSDEFPENSLSVTFEMINWPDLATAHIPVMIDTSPNQGYGSVSGVRPLDPPVSGHRYKLTLGVMDNQTWADATRSVLLQGDAGARNKLFMAAHDAVLIASGLTENAATVRPGIDDTLHITMNRVMNGWAVAQADQPRLNALCTAVTSGPDNLPQAAVSITVSSAKSEKANEILSFVRTYMCSRGVNRVSLDEQAVITSRKWHLPFAAPKATKDVEIRILPLQEMIKRTDKSRAFGAYTVTAHEFGHLLGLPDEYLDYSGMNNQQIRASQPNWDAMCARHTPPVPTRDWRGAFNQSIMSVGVVVYKCHAVTIWQALCTASGSNRWTIVSP